MIRRKRVKQQHFKKNRTEDKIQDFYFLFKTCALKVVKRVYNELEIVTHKAYSHNFRHTFSVNMVKNTKDICLVSKLFKRIGKNEYNRND